MSAPLLRRAAAALAPRGARRFAGGPPGGFFGEGAQKGGHNGYLFGELPPPFGQSRVMEAWELPWCAAAALWGAAACGSAGSVPAGCAPCKRARRSRQP
jgi:hypothetical protein